jgi:phage/plasmid-like protein (TIGR03299 family)
VHQYSEWLVKNVGTILDDDLAIDSAGLLAGGGVAWVSVSLPDTIETQAGFPIRPRLLAFTAHNSKYMTTYKRSLEAPICDNSLDLEVRRDANAENKQEWRQKHTSNSHLAIAGAREALGILYQQADEMVAFVDELSQWEVTNAEFKKLMDALHPVPMPEMEGGKVANKRAITNVTNRRGEITTMYLKDDRAAPWKGTALGVLQAFNTWHQHGRTIRGERVERKMLDTLATDVADFDAIVLNSLAELCDRDLVAVGSGD